MKILWHTIVKREGRKNSLESILNGLSWFILAVAAIYFLPVIINIILR